MYNPKYLGFVWSAREDNSALQSNLAVTLCLICTCMHCSERHIHTHQPYSVKGQLNEKGLLYNS